MSQDEHRAQTRMVAAVLERKVHALRLDNRLEPVDCQTGGVIVGPILRIFKESALHLNEAGWWQSVHQPAFLRT